MGKVSQTDSFPTQLSQAISSDLRSLGLRAKIHIEPVRTTRLVRVFVITSQRDRLEPSEWRRLLEGIFERQFTPKDLLRVSAFYTLTPQEHRKYRANVRAEEADKTRARDDASSRRGSRSARLAS